MSDSAPAAQENVVQQTDKITPQIAFGSMAGIMTSESDKFLQAFLSGARTLDAKNIQDDFLTRFVQHADNFTVSCCERFAAFLKEFSMQGDVRATSEAVLSRLVRNRCFEAMDVLLSDYLDLLKRANINISQPVGQLAESRVRDCFSLPGAADSSQDEQRKLLAPQAARAAALVKILDYFAAFGPLAREFLDYGASKLFGGDVDFTLQERFLRTITDAVQEKLRNAVGTLEGLDLVKQRKWDQQRAAESATIRAVAMMAGQSQVKRKSGMSSIVIAVFCLPPIWLVFQLGAVNRYTIGAAIVFGLVAILFFFRGIIHLTKG